MKIHHYNDEYTSKNGINGVKEFALALIFGLLILVPVILASIETISWLYAIICIIILLLLVIYFIRKVGVINKASMSVIIEDGDELYYMMISPNLRGSMFPKSFSALLAGSSATYVENKIDAEATAIVLASDDNLIKALFELYKNDEIKTSFDTIMYGKPIYVSKLLNQDFKKENKKIYKVNCVKDNGKTTRVKIPRAFPTYFN